ncbi:5-oxoprolinase subunit PxpB [Fournierella massiliensis]|nr:5-oxoprolinase subunit PxpB [Fournierella massiliensis]MCF2556424.1 5-oxoprolinase subunit PxpB [Fournierella massiliensis]
MDTYTLHDVGDQALLVEFENKISIEVNRKVVALKRALEEQRLFGVGEMVPTYRSLLLHYDPLKADPEQLKEAIAQSVRHLDLSALPKAIVTEIPVLYEGEYALDLEEIARIEGKTEEEIIRIHSQSDYYVYMLGFAPGHPYTARFENPFSFKRRETPRVKIPAGSIVVQLGLSDIIPFEQPCGWNIIGTTPLLACDYRKDNPFLLKAGQWIRHIPVDKAEFLDIKRRVELGCYQPRTYEKEG